MMSKKVGIVYNRRGGGVWGYEEGQGKVVGDRRVVMWMDMGG